MRRTALLLIFVAGVGVTAAQGPMAAPTEPAFEIASVRENTGTSSAQSFRWADTGLTVTNMPLGTLLVFAYGITTADGVVGAPGWVQTARYDIVASFGDRVERNQFRRMAALQGLLADRFKLVIRPLSEEQPAYALVRRGDRLGPSMKQVECLRGEPGDSAQSPSPKCGFTADRSAGTLKASGMTMPELSLLLRTVVGRPVLNKTDLVGSFAVQLTWAPEERGVGADSKVSDRASVFTAVQEQLGLRLVPDVAPASRFRVVHVERPTPN